MKRWVFIIPLLAAASLLRGAEMRYQLKDGTWLEGADVERRGTTLVVAVDASGAGAERVFPVGAVVRLDGDEPAGLAEARAAKAAGDRRSALIALESVRTEFVLFATLPGAWWTEASLLRLRILVEDKAWDEAESAARELIATIPDEQVRAQARLALCKRELAQGSPVVARGMLAVVMRGAGGGDVPAEIALIEGDLALAEGDPVRALEAYLRVIVFHGLQADAGRRSRLGAVRSYLALGDRERAVREARRLADESPNAPETAEAASLLTKLPP